MSCLSAISPEWRDLPYHCNDNIYFALRRCSMRVCACSAHRYRPTTRAAPEGTVTSAQLMTAPPGIVE